MIKRNFVNLNLKFNPNFKTNLNILILTFLVSYLFTHISCQIDYLNEDTWGDKCKTFKNTTNQSPIDIPSFSKSNSIYNTTQDYIQIIETDYKQIKGNSSAKFLTLFQQRFWVKLENMGRLNISKNETSLYYKLEYAQIHMPSEHTIDGKKYDMELQIKHTKRVFWQRINGLFNDPDSKTDHLIVAVLFNRTIEGKDYPDNPDIKSMKLDVIRSENNTNSTIIENFNFDKYVNKSNAFYSYSGSLTNPLCNSPVDWIIFEDIQQLSFAQYENMKKWVQILYPLDSGNARNIQPFNDRKIYYRSSHIYYIFPSYLIIIMISIIFIIE